MFSAQLVGNVLCFLWQNWNRRIAGKFQQFFIDVNNGKISLCWYSVQLYCLHTWKVLRITVIYSEVVHGAYSCILSLLIICCYRWNLPNAERRNLANLRHKSIPECTDWTFFFTDACYRPLNEDYNIELKPVKWGYRWKFWVCLGTFSNSSNEMAGKDKGDANSVRNITESV